MLIFNYLWRWTLFYYLWFPVSSLGDCKIQVLLFDYNVLIISILNRQFVFSSFYRFLFYKKKYFFLSSFFFFTCFSVKMDEI